MRVIGDVIQIKALFVALLTLVSFHADCQKKVHGFSFELGKSIFYIPENRWSFGRASNIFPEPQASLYFDRSSISVAYRYYEHSYNVDYRKGDIEHRRFDLYELMFRRHHALLSKRVQYSIGGGFSLRSIYETEILGIIKHVYPSGCLIEIFSDVNLEVSPGLIVCADIRYDLTQRLFIETEFAYSAFLSRYHIARAGVSVGYYFGKR